MSGYASAAPQLGITEEDKNWLFNNIDTLTKNIADPDEINAALLGRGVFTLEMKLKVEALLAANDKVKAIMELILERGKYAFDILCQVLKDTNNLDAADFLKPTAIGCLDEESLTNEIQVIHCKQSSGVYKEHWNKPTTYIMNKQRRGRAIIINNKYFRWIVTNDGVLYDRNGTDLDRDRLKVLFEQLFFEVVVYEDQTAQNIKMVLEKEKEDQYHKFVDCFILVILTHGAEDGIYGVDGNIVSEETITGYFMTRSCPNLAGKPKIFFIQACKLDNTYMKDTSLTESDHMPESKTELDNIGILSQEMQKEALFGPDRKPEPKHQDILVAFPTRIGFISLRNTVYGSWYIQALILVFQRCSHKEDLLGLLTLVHFIVAKQWVHDPETKLLMRQTAILKSSLAKKLYFFPGCSE